MEMKAAFEIASAVLLGLGGGGALVLSMSAWLGRLWADRFMAKETARHNVELEQLRMKLNAEFSERDRLNRERWELKRQGCLAALGLVDKVMTNIPWDDQNSPGETLRISRLPVDPSEARDVMNRLILACDDSTVLRLFLKCIGLQDETGVSTFIDPADVQNLRNAIRRELGFGKDLDSKVFWITTIHGDDVIKTEQDQLSAQQAVQADGAAPGGSPA